MYYMIEIWWNRMVARDKTANAERPIFSRDCALILGFAAVWAAALVGVALATAVGWCRRPRLRAAAVLVRDDRFRYVHHTTS